MDEQTINNIGNLLQVYYARREARKAQGTLATTIHTLQPDSELEAQVAEWMVTLETIQDEMTQVLQPEMVAKLEMDYEAGP